MKKQRQLPEVIWLVDRAQDSSPVSMAPNSETAIIIHIISNLNDKSWLCSILEGQVHPPDSSSLRWTEIGLELHPVASSPQPRIQYLITSCLLLCTNVSCGSSLLPRSLANSSRAETKSYRLHTSQRGRIRAYWINTCWLKVPTRICPWDLIPGV